ncbi:hypothetical protein [Rheinheimera fenheensis]|uniref:hypothetical protein n=1 Tax=Rheinheimera fenheensis TaxID=3152295 RepID=UPI003261924A
MPLKKLPIAICLGLSLSLSAGNAFADEENEPASFGKQILDKAKSKFISAAGGQLSSLLIDAIFGSSSPSYVSLSQESLQAIQDRVRIELVDTAEFEYFAELESIQLSMQYFNDTAANGTPDIAVLGSLLTDSDGLITHHALNSQFNDEYYYMADTLGLAASINLSIYVERHLQGFITQNAVRARANLLANRLDTMLIAKKQADLPLRENCVMHTDDQYAEEKCRLVDPHGTTHAMAILDYWNDRDYEEWEIKKQLTNRQYYADKFSEIEAVIARLRNF